MITGCSYMVKSNKIESSWKSSLSNCAPLSVTHCFGTPNREIQPERKKTTEVGVVSMRGIASVHLVALSIQVSRYLYGNGSGWLGRKAGGRGPTMSICTR